VTTDYFKYNDPLIIIHRTGTEDDPLIGVKMKLLGIFVIQVIIGILLVVIIRVLDLVRLY